LIDGRHPGPNPEAVTCQRKELQEVLASISRLPDRERQAMLLVMDGDLDVASAAGLLGISRSAYKMRVHRARQRLIRQLESSDD
jgi:RNA polymerase sigma-70 factor (ECF subfamily)